jgi:large subunit ribosomal protein L25
MADIRVIPAQTRERAGKGAARAVRNTGYVPGVIYGNKQDPLSISIELGVLEKEINQPGVFARMYDIDVAGSKHRALLRDLQLHPVTDKALHVDFLRLSADATINVEIPVVFLNEEDSPGLSRGGVLNIVRHTVEVICKPGDIPEQIVCDLSGLEIGDSVHISAVTLPDGVEPTIDDRDFTIATIAAPTVVAEEAAEEAAEDEDAETAEGEGEDEGNEDEDKDEG